MRVFILIAFILFGVYTYYLWLSSGGSNGMGDKTTSGPRTTENKNSVNLSFADQELTIAWLKVSPEKLSLYSNLKDDLPSREALKEKACSSLVSGGFYTKEGKHIGLFVTEGKKLQDRIQSSFFNGFLSVDKEGNISISGSAPQNNTRFALQSGPILMQNGQVRKITLEDDKPARRIIAAISGEEVLFLAVFEKDSAYLGPTLENTPQILQKFQEESEIKLEDAINLDGGKASAFLTESVSLGELTLIGSYFCIK